MTNLHKLFVIKELLQLSTFIVIFHFGIIIISSKVYFDITDLMLSFPTCWFIMIHFFYNILIIITVINKLHCIKLKKKINS